VGGVSEERVLACDARTGPFDFRPVLAGRAIAGSIVVCHDPFVGRLRWMLIGFVLAGAALAGPVGAVGHLVRIPDPRGASVVTGYARLHRDGLGVSVPGGFEVDDLVSPAAVIERISPAPGRAVRPGSTVALEVGCPDCGVGTPAVPRHIPTYKVPSFIGDRISVPERWIRHKTLYETEYFGSLRAGTASQLYGNYRIVRQRPSPRAELKLGVGGRVSPTLGSFLPTPLTLWLTQGRQGQ
jgi:hypothetical protein